jgi:hypothetical protein
MYPNTIAPGRNVVSAAMPRMIDLGKPLLSVCRDPVKLAPS